MTVKHPSRALPESYFELVRLFPLTHLRDDDHLEEAQEMIDQLLKREEDEGVQEYLNVLTDLVEAYEDEHYPIPSASTADMLRELMRGHDLTEAKLAQKTGVAESTLSAVLRGSGSLTRNQACTLATFFCISPNAFSRS
jgi:HTH-type transcriptional regulator/antitoxin HigA